MWWLCFIHGVLEKLNNTSEDSTPSSIESDILDVLHTNQSTY